MDNLENEFDQELRDSIRHAKALGYNPTRFAEMLNSRGGVPLARHLVQTGEIQDGLHRLVALGRHDLTMEAIMLQPKYESLFDYRIRDAARWRLEQATKPR